MRKYYFLLMLLALLPGCSTYEFPGVHRITIQQGNVVTQTMIDKLKPGMTKRQVQFVLGNPVIDDQLDKDRWDYIYTIDIPGLTRHQQNLQVYFIDERLSYFEGDYAPSDALATKS
ncbi:MAG: outer membrane protein assembly factor BamE [Candidatus Azotimanducaceae bacterium]|jgi:outer membrane protein assembly factor BamE